LASVNALVDQTPRLLDAGHLDRPVVVIGETTIARPIDLIDIPAVPGAVPREQLGAISTMPLRDQLLWTGIQSATDAAGLARATGLDEQFLTDVLMKRRATMSIDDVRTISEAMHIDPYDIWPPDVIEDQIIEQYPPSTWPEVRQRDFAVGRVVIGVMEFTAVAGVVALSPELLDAAGGLLVAARDNPELHDAIAKLSALATTDPAAVVALSRGEIRETEPVVQSTGVVLPFRGVEAKQDVSADYSISIGLGMGT
jgi:hypothetical protein